jgi:hypothetical protein
VSSLAETGCARVAGRIHEGDAALVPPTGRPRHAFDRTPNP